MNLESKPLGQLSLYACIVALLIGIIRISPFHAFLHLHIWEIFFFLFFLSMSTTGLTYLALQKAPKKFRTNYLLIITIRLLIAMIILGYAVYMHISNLKIFVINYFIIYLIFVIFELFALNLNISGNSGRKGKYF